jgi:2,3-dihydroxybenzoate decarboxylase
MKKIALEEHFMAPGLEEYWQSTMGNVAKPMYDHVSRRLSDFGELRLREMDEAGIEIAVLGLAGPGVQIEADAKLASRKAAQANDFLARVVRDNPKRYSGFAHLALQDPVSAGKELERCVRQLGFCGAMINGHTNGQYLDDPALYPFWEQAEALGTPIYLHPTDPVATYSVLVGCDSLKRAMWEWGLETGSHALRLIFNGVFDRFPGAKLILGHLGETLPFLLWRFDSRAKLYGLKLKRAPSQYIRNNIWVTTSGMFSADPLLCSINALGHKRVMFSADFPFESTQEAAKFMDEAPLEQGIKNDIAHANAESLLGLGATRPAGTTR